MFRTRWIALGLIAAVILGFVIGVFHWDNSGLKCQYGKNWTSSRWYVLYSVGHFEFRIRDWNYDCPADDKYDPKVFKPL